MPVSFLHPMNHRGQNTGCPPFLASLQARMRFAWFVIFVLLIGSPGAHADELTGLVVGIADGDTLRVLVDRREVRVRLDQIDAPEKAQAFGQRSRQSLAEMAFRQSARVVTHGTDRYGRTVGTVYVDGRDVNAEQVRRGLAWVYPRYAHDAALYDLQRQAQADRRGLWADADPVPPWEWRRSRRQR